MSGSRALELYLKDEEVYYRLICIAICLWRKFECYLNLLVLNSGYELRQHTIYSHYLQNCYG